MKTGKDQKISKQVRIKTGEKLSLSNEYTLNM